MSQNLGIDNPNKTEKIMVDPKDLKLSYIKNYSRILLFFFLGLSIFFIAGFVIISLNVSSRENILVPAVVGKLYLDEHNHLVDEGFKVELEWSQTTTYPYGYILAQSESPGKVIKSGSKIVLLVNQSTNVVTVPKLIGRSEDFVEQMLKTIPVGSRLYALQKGLITYVNDLAPKGEILAQFPPEQTPVKPDSFVSLLVSLGPKDANKIGMSPEIKGQHIELIKSLAYLKKVPLKIDIVETKDERQNNLIQNFQGDMEKGSLSVTVGQFQFEDRLKRAGYQMQYLENDDLDLDKGAYTVLVRSDDIETLNSEITSEKENKKNKVTAIKKIDTINYLEITEKSILPVFQGFNTVVEVYEGYLSVDEINEIDNPQIQEVTILEQESIETEEQKRALEAQQEASRELMKDMANNTKPKKEEIKTFSDPQNEVTKENETQKIKKVIKKPVLVKKLRQISV